MSTFVVVGLQDDSLLRRLQLGLRVGIGLLLLVRSLACYVANLSLAYVRFIIFIGDGGPLAAGWVGRRSAPVRFPPFESPACCCMGIFIIDQAPWRSELCPCAPRVDYQ